MNTNQSIIQGSLFEEDYLVRTLGVLAQSSDVALTELVANAWDAGAARVDITIPKELDAELIVEDDGCGMTLELFHKRWMTLGYNREHHQGVLAEFPKERIEWRRPAYGRHGIGRHGLLCFAKQYTVETRRDDDGMRFIVSTSSGRNPFVLIHENEFDAQEHGTRLSTQVKRNLPAPAHVRDILSARFLHDPNFLVTVNGESVPLERHVGLIEQTELNVADELSVEIFFIDSTQAARTIQRQGIAFWAANRLVGEPSWILGSRLIIDGRTHLAKRHTVVVKSDELIEEVMPDWSGFRDTPLVKDMQRVVGDYVERMFTELARDRIQETASAVKREHKIQIDGLPPLARYDVEEFIEELTSKLPLLKEETVSLAVQAVINLERSRSGSSLLEKLARLSENDIESLDRLLNEWSVRDALTVLDEIDGRMVVIEAIKKLSGDSDVDELHTLHPLVTQARWLFGPEFDSPEYASNLTLRKAVERVFGQQVDKTAFIDPLKRPDLVVLADSSLSVVGTEKFEDNDLCVIQDILLIEVKKGASKIGRKEMNQAEGYAEDILNSGFIEGRPRMHVFVVGEEIERRVEPIRTLGSPEYATIKAATYSQLVRTAEKRLFNLRERLSERYEKISGVDLLRQFKVNSTEVGQPF